MIITLIEQHEYDFLLDIQKRFPALTFQNNGYEYIDKSKLTEEDKQAWKDVEDLLERSIKGFSCFKNFCHTRKKELQIRFDYDWSWTMNDDTGETYQKGISFTGVDYLKVTELLNGFENKET